MQVESPLVETAECSLAFLRPGRAWIWQLAAVLQPGSLLLWPQHQLEHMQIIIADRHAELLGGWAAGQCGDLALLWQK